MGNWFPHGLQSQNARQITPTCIHPTLMTTICTLFSFWANGLASWNSEMQDSVFTAVTEANRNSALNSLKKHLILSCLKKKLLVISREEHVIDTWLLAFADLFYHLLSVGIMPISGVKTELIILWSTQEVMVITSTGNILSDNSPERRLESTQKMRRKLYCEILLSLSIRCPLCALSEAGALQREKKKQKKMLLHN